MHTLIVIAVLIAGWLGLGLVFIALCRMAATGDGRESEGAGELGVGGARAAVPRSLAAGLVVWEEPPDVDAELRKLVLRGRAGRARGARFAAGS